MRATELCALQVMPLQDALIAAYRERFVKQDAELLRRQAHLKGLPQSFFGISDLSTSHDGWSQAVDALSDLDDALHVTPNMRLKILIYVKVCHVWPSTGALNLRAADTVYLNRYMLLLLPRRELTRVAVEVAVERCYAAELRDRGDKHKPLSADDMLPIFSWVVAHASVQSLYATTEYLRDITARGFNQYGEAAYYLCVLEAAIYHLLTIKLPVTS